MSGQVLDFLYDLAQLSSLISSYHTDNLPQRIHLDLPADNS